MVKRHNCQRKFFYLESIDSILGLQQPGNNTQIKYLKELKAKTNEIKHDDCLEYVNKYYEYEESIPELVELS